MSFRRGEDVVDVAPRAVAQGLADRRVARGVHERRVLADGDAVGHEREDPTSLGETRGFVVTARVLEVVARLGEGSCFISRMPCTMVARPAAPLGTKNA